MRRTAALVFAVLCAAPGVAEPPPVASLVERLGSEDPDERASAREQLRDAGAAAVRDLQALAAGTSPQAAVAKTILHQVEFDTRAAAAMAGGPSWYRWERGTKTAWICLDASRNRDGWTLRETLFMDTLRLATVAEVDRDFRTRSLVSTLTAGGKSSETRATFTDEGCTVDDGTTRTPLPAAGIPLTDWTVLRFAPSFLAWPPHEPELIVWDSLDSEPASSFLRFGDPEVVPGPADSVRARGVKIEGLMTVWVTEDGKVSHATRGEGSRIVPAEAKDVPEEFRK